MEMNLTQGRPAAVLVKYSIPIIIGNVFQQMYNLVDTIIVGRFVSYQALAGVGITNGICFFILGLLLGITSGLGIRTAQYYGAGDKAGVRASFRVSLLICAAMAVLLTVGPLLLTDPLLRMMHTQVGIYPYARGYLRVMFLGISAQIGYNMIACTLRALGDSRTPLYFLIFSSVLNIGLDLLFIRDFGWGVEGAAWATVCAQGVSALLCTGYALWRYPFLRGKCPEISWKMAAEHLEIGVPMALQFAITGIGLIMLQAAINAFPASYIAGFTAANKIQNIGQLVAVSFGVAIANYCGQNLGAGEIGRVRQGVRATFWISMSLCVVICVLMVALAEPLTRLFIDGEALASGDAPDMIMASRWYLVASALFFPVLYVLILYRNALQGLGQTFWPLVGGVVELIARAGASLTLPRIFGYNGIVIIDMLAWIGAAIVVTIAYICWCRKTPSGAGA